jgi:beta-galactosidase/beta-glucuronidase
VIPAGSSKVIVTKGTINDPALWSVENPNLYRLTTRIDAVSKDGCHYFDSYDQRVGIRKIQFDADKGFFLNDKPLKLKGVCVHHDAGCLGAAVPPEVWLRRLNYLKDMGCNAIRMSHNPHMPQVYDLCDALGFLVMDEAFDEWEGAKNKWSVGHNVYPPKHQGYFEDFPEWHERDLADLIKRDRNHPSIIMWSIGNEIDYPNDPYCHPMFTSMTGNNDNNKPKAERQYNPDKPNAERLSVIAAKLTRIVKACDTTRPVTAAAAFPELSAKIGFIDSFDVVGYNYKEQYYEDDHRNFPDKPFLGSENSHSYQAWKAVRDQEFISAQFLWTGIDYLGEAHGWPIHGSGAGVLSTAGFPKVSYYRRKSFGLLRRWCIWQLPERTPEN